MAESKPDEREVARPQTDAGVARGTPLKNRAVPPPLPPTGPRSSRVVRAAAAAPAETVEAPSFYSQVGRRSSPGMPAVSITVESVGNVAASRPPPAAAPTPRTEVSTSMRGDESFDFDGSDPPTQKHIGRSARPPAPDPFAADAAGVESIAQTFDRLLGSEVDSRFGEIKQASEAPPALGPGSLDDPRDLAEVRDLFEQLAANHVRPVREFVIDLRWGEASREWISVCASALDSLQRAAQKLGLRELDAALGTFAGVIQSAAAADGAIIEGAPRDAILAAYDQLTLALPNAFALDLDSSQRESLIVQSLLLQIPEVHRVTIDRLRAAGLNGIAMLADARAQEVAETTGIARQLADRIVEVFRAYREDSRAHLPDAIHGRERERLDRLLNELEAHHAAFEHAAEGWSREATVEKARLRRARHKTLMEISVILARSGEIALLKTLEMVPFDRKLDGLRAYLKTAPSSFARTP